MLSTSVNYKGRRYTVLCALTLGSISLRCGAKHFGLSDRSFVLSGFSPFVAFFDNEIKAQNFFSFLSTFKYDPDIMPFKMDSFEKNGKIWFRVYAPISEWPVKHYYYGNFRSLCKYYRHHVQLSCLYVS